MIIKNVLDFEGLSYFTEKIKTFVTSITSKLEANKLDKTTVATSSTLGLVKSGTDITVDTSGNVSVNDNSHKHTVSNISDLTANATELNYVDGVTSNIQTQLNSKQPNITGGATTITSSNLTASRALISNSSGKVAVSDVTSTELGYLDGVTSSIQTQLDTKAPLASPTLTGTPKAPTATAGTNSTQIATTAFVRTAVSNLVNSAPETLDTLGEIADALKDNADIVDVLNESITTKANASDLTSHTSNTTVHITATERSNWNDANTKKHEHSNKTILDNTTASYTTEEKEKLSGIKEGTETTAATISGSNPTATNSANAPLIYGKIKGYTLQEGEPTPDNPIDIKGLGNSGTIEVKTCGKNLANPNNFITGKVVDYNSGTILDNTSYSISGYIEIKPNATYTKQGFTEGLENWVYDSNKNPISAIVANTFETPSNAKYVVLSHLNSNTSPWQLEEGTVVTPYEPYTETVATIPIDTLYEGDYLEVYADGSGKIVHKSGVGITNVYSSWCVNPYTTHENTSIFRGLVENLKNVTHCNKLRKNNGVFFEDSECFGYTNGDFDYRISNERLGVTSESTETACLNAIKKYLTDNEFIFVGELKEPTAELLTAEQVQAFKQLYTFDNVTNFFCDGELTARYYCNTDSGDTVGMIQETVDGLQKTVKEIPDTYTTQSDFDRIVGGTVTDSGLTNVSYIVPYEISDGSISFDSYTSGTLVDALRKATNQITMFLGTLFEEGDESVVFENDSVAGTLEVFRHKLSEGTYLLDIKVTITSITETLSGNGPSVDLTLQDIGFEDNIISARESECLLASYYPLIVNGSSYCLGGGMVSTENSTKGFYLRFLPHKNTKGFISSNNKSVLSGTMMIKVVEQQL